MPQIETFISLFAGCGGLDLAIGLAVPGSRCVCYVEREVEAAEILAARFADAALDDAPVWSDVSSFDGKPWRGLVDGIAGGFPCQDLSVAGKRAGIQRGNRSGLFYEYVRIIREVEPGWVYIENVPAALAFPAGGIILGELAALGFDAEWGTLRASDVGASHKRRRIWVLAYRKTSRAFSLSLHASMRLPIPGTRWGRSGPRFAGVSDSQSLSGSPSGLSDTSDPRIANGYQLADPEREHDDRSWIERQGRRRQPADCRGDMAYADGERRREARGVRCGADSLPDGSSTNVDESESMGCRDGNAANVGAARGNEYPSCDASQELGHTDDAGLEINGGPGGDGAASPETARQAIERAGSDMAGVFATGPLDAIWSDVLVRDYGLRPALSPAEAESCLRRVADGLASPLDQRIDRLRACGNGVVAVQGAAAFRELVRRAGGLSV